ncbi:hypothetical protein [Modestobacter sp. VKM Ac-2984]|uniref:hypothetical protein n=1 Tax=Modestobacter sp. VKM Ac-2984 TaxID=3004138 RepID=UPI0022AB0B84|nr:hypothetical protein [Modestobacter sp. VKM Ac-2984]MCZ2817999.1 hypothetical protein [Modestobacter sp. VKM Ac-2984]
MSELLYLLVLLACPVGMGAMMWWMSRSHGSAPQPNEDDHAELAGLRAEVDELRAERSTTDSHPGRAERSR